MQNQYLSTSTYPCGYRTSGWWFDAQCDQHAPLASGQGVTMRRVVGVAYYLLVSPYSRCSQSTTRGVGWKTTRNHKACSTSRSGGPRIQGFLHSGIVQSGLYVRNRLRHKLLWSRSIETNTAKNITAQMSYIVIFYTPPEFPGDIELLYA